MLNKQSKNLDKSHKLMKIYQTSKKERLTMLMAMEDRSQVEARVLGLINSISMMQKISLKTSSKITHSMMTSFTGYSVKKSKKIAHLQSSEVGGLETLLVKILSYQRI